MSKYKKKPLSIDVGGKSIEALMKYNYTELSKMGERDLRAIASRLVSASNKRIRRLQKNNLDVIAPAMYDIKKEFSLKGAKSREQVLHNIARMKLFLNRKTSTVKGFKEVKKKTYARILGVEATKKIKNPFDTKEQERDYWEKYRKIMEDKYMLSDKTAVKLVSDEIQKQLYKSKKKGTFSGKDIIDNMNKIIEEAKKKKSIENLNDANSFFVEDEYEEFYNMEDDEI